MKSRFLFFICLLVTIRLFAQDNTSYAVKAAQIQKDVWSTTVPEFKATKIPENLSKESAVILARSFSSQRTSAGRIKFLVITYGVTTRTIKLNTLHERVKINDKAALENFSKITYQKKLQKSEAHFVIKLVDAFNTFIGAKIIKPDGSVVIVNTGEEVLTKNQNKNQQGKLAISGLEVGDILDYYVSTTEFSELAEGDSYKDNENLLLLADEYPVLYYSIDFQFNKKVDVKYIYANGAPHFMESNNDTGDLLLSLKIRNMAKYKSQLWTSRLRQYPYIEIGSSFTKNYNLTAHNDKKLKEEPSMFEGNRLLYQSLFTEVYGSDNLTDKLKDYFKTRKALKSAPLDTVMKALYDQWKFWAFCSYSEKHSADLEGMNYRVANGRAAAIKLSIDLTRMEIDNDVLLVASRNSNSLANVYGLDDFEAIIRINGPKPMYMSFDDVVTNFNEIPARFQGEMATALHPTRHNALNYSFENSQTSLPVISSDRNLSEEQLQVSMLPSDMNKLKINRVVKQTGSLRHDNQKALLTSQEIDDEFMNLAKGNSLEKRISSLKFPKQSITDYTNLCQKQLASRNKDFSDEIKSQLDLEPQQLSNCKIINTALDNSNQAFEFSASFVLDNLVKKAGKNFIINAGLLTGSFLKLDEKDKNRDVDVYMPSARSFLFTISFAIPQGYSVKGVEDLNQQKTNKTGSFTSTATIDGGTLTITVKRVYTHNFEKVADWPMLKEIIETSSNFNDQKILLEKKA